MRKSLNCHKELECEALRFKFQKPFDTIRVLVVYAIGVVAIPYVVDRVKKIG